MEQLDLRGMNCPVPVIETKRFLETKAVHEIEVLVDNEVSKENVSRFLQSQGFATISGSKGNDFTVTGARSKEAAGPGPKTSVETGKTLVFIDGDTLGRGSEELGGVLMRSFLITLKDLPEKPWRIVFINSGVKLVAEGSALLAVLKDLEMMGVEVLACGTCLDYFRLKDQVKTGRISNMYEIVTSFLQATHVINP